MCIMKGENELNEAPWQQDRHGRKGETCEVVACRCGAQLEKYGAKARHGCGDGQQGDDDTSLVEQHTSQTNVFGTGAYSRPYTECEIECDPDVPADQHPADQAPVAGHHGKRKQAYPSRDEEPPTDPYDPQRLQPFMFDDLIGACHNRSSLACVFAFWA